MCISIPPCTGEAAVKIPPWTLTLEVNGLADNWEIDSGAVVAICGEDMYREWGT